MTAGGDPEVLAAWEANAEFWDELMGEHGNEFARGLVGPATRALLGEVAGARVLEVACGTGLGTRALLAAGAEVVAVDVSPRMIERARARAPSADYRVLDAADEAALLSLGTDGFDAAVAMMALMDMPAIDPLYRALARLLRPGGRFVFTVLHPAFNHARAGFVLEHEETPAGPRTRRSIKVSGYLTPLRSLGKAARTSPVAHPYFDRPLSALLGPAFAAGLVLDGLLEPAFAAEEGAPERLSWGPTFCEFPAVLAVRLRRPPV